MSDRENALRLADPIEIALGNAPHDDEPESEEERLAVFEAKAWLQSNGGKVIPHLDAMRMLGLE